MARALNSALLKMAKWAETRLNTAGTSALRLQWHGQFGACMWSNKYLGYGTIHFRCVYGSGFSSTTWHVSSLELQVNKHHNKRGPDARGMTSRLQHHPGWHEICQRLGASFPLPATPIFSFSPQALQTTLLFLHIGAINCKNRCTFSTCRRASRKDTVPPATLLPYPVQHRQQLLPSNFLLLHR
jgi:hypothetical protein